MPPIEKSSENLHAFSAGGFRSHWKKIAVPSGILLTASLVVTGILIGVYFAQPHLLAGHSAYVLFGISGTPGGAALILFAIGSVYLCLRKGEAPILDESGAGDIESDSESEASERHRDKTVSLREDEEEESFSISERNVEEFSENSIEEIKKGTLLSLEVDDESPAPSKIQAQVSSEAIKGKEEEEIEELETSPSSEASEADENIETSLTQKEVFEKVFDPVFDSLRSFVSALVAADYYAHNGLKYNGTHPKQLQTTLDTLHEKLEELREFFKDKTKNTEFLLKGCLSHILEPETGNNVLRQMVVAHNCQNEEKGEKLQKHINKIKSSRDLTNIKVLFDNYNSRNDVSDLLGHFKEILKKKFTLDDRFIEGIVGQIIDSLFDEVDVKAPEFKRRMEFVVAAAPRYVKGNHVIAQPPGKDERHFIDSLNFLIGYLFDQAYSKKKEEIDGLAQQIIDYALLKASNPDTIDEAMKHQVKRLLKILPRALGGMDIYYSSTKNAAPAKMNKHFLDVESTDSQSDNEELNELQAQLFEIQIKINANRTNDGHPCPVALLVLDQSEVQNYLDNPIVAYCYGIKNTSPDQSRNRALQHLGDLQNTLPKEIKQKISQLEDEKAIHIIAIPCGKKDSPLALIKGLEGRGGLVRKAVSVGETLLSFLNSALPSLMGPINKAMQIPGLSTEELKDHRDRMLTLLPIAAYPIVDALVSDSHDFRKLFQQLFHDHKGEILEELQEISRTEDLSWVTLRDMFLGKEQGGKKRGIPRLTELLENTYLHPKH